jgi:acyl carrier protein
MWGDLLKISKYSMDDNFFDLGGHSLLLAEMQGRIDKELDCKLSITDLFSNPTIRLLSKFLSGIKDQSDNLIRIRERAHKQHFAVQNLDR